MASDIVSYIVKVQYVVSFVNSSVREFGTVYHRFVISPYTILVSYMGTHKYLR